MAPPVMRRTLLTALVAVPLLLVAGDVAAWRWATQQLRTGLDRWVAAQRAAGWTVVNGAPVAGGWPLAASLTVPGVRLSGDTAVMPGGLSWSVPEVGLRAELLHPDRLVVTPHGQQLVTVAGFPAIPLDADSMQAVVSLQAGAPTPVNIVASGVRAGAAGDAGLRADAARLRLAPGASPQGATGFELELDGILLPAAGNWPLGRNVASVMAGGTLEPPPAGTRAVAPAGASVQVRAFALAWGALHVQASANLALDNQMQPFGAAQVQMTGQSQAVDAAAGSGLIKPQMALGAKAVLALMSHPSADGTSETDVPLTLQDGTLSMGRIPLVRLPRIAWPPA